MSAKVIRFPVSKLNHSQKAKRIHWMMPRFFIDLRDLDSTTEVDSLIIWVRQSIIPRSKKARKWLAGEEARSLFLRLNICPDEALVNLQEKWDEIERMQAQFKLFGMQKELAYLNDEINRIGIRS